MWQFKCHVDFPYSHIPHITIGQMQRTIICKINFAPTFRMIFCKNESSQNMGHTGQNEYHYRRVRDYKKRTHSFFKKSSD